MRRFKEKPVWQTIVSGLILSTFNRNSHSMIEWLFK